MKIKNLEKYILINILIISIFTISWIYTFRIGHTNWCEDGDKYYIPYFITNGISACKNLELLISTAIYQLIIGVIVLANILYFAPRAFENFSPEGKSKYFLIVFVIIIYIFWSTGKLETFLHFRSAADGGIFGPIMAAASLYLTSLFGYILAAAKS